MQVHDELIFEIAESDLEAAQAKIVDIMENSSKIDVPLFSRSRRWDELGRDALEFQAIRLFRNTERLLRNQEPFLRKKPLAILINIYKACPASWDKGQEGM